MTVQDSALQKSNENHQEISCSSQPVSFGSIVYTNVHPEDPVVISNCRQRAAKAQHLTLGSDTQLLLSGMQTIPEQVPLILTEEDAEEESFTVMAGTEHLQVKYWIKIL